MPAPAGMPAAVQTTTMAVWCVDEGVIALKPRWEGRLIHRHDAHSLVVDGRVAGGTEHDDNRRQHEEWAQVRHVRKKKGRSVEFFFGKVQLTTSLDVTDLKLALRYVVCIPMYVWTGGPHVRVGVAKRGHSENRALYTCFRRPRSKFGDSMRGGIPVFWRDN